MISYGVASPRSLENPHTLTHSPEDPCRNGQVRWESEGVSGEKSLPSGAPGGVRGTGQLVSCVTWVRELVPTPVV